MNSKLIRDKIITEHKAQKDNKMMKPLELQESLIFFHLILM